MKKFFTALRGFFTLIVAVVIILIFAILCLVTRLLGPTLPSFLARVCMSLIALTAGCRIKTYGLENLNPRSHYLFLGNHQSYFDIVALYKAVPFRLSFMAKKQLFMVPFFGWGMLALGHIPLDRGNPRKAKVSMTKAVNLIHKRRRSVIAFPEGTRSPTGEMGNFKLGAFGLARKVQIEVVPVTINGARKVLPKKSLFPRPGVIELHFSDPIPYEVFKPMGKNEMAALVREKIEVHLKPEMNLG